MFLSGEVIDPFDLIKNIGITDDRTIRETSVSAYQLFMTIGIIGLVFTLIITGVRLALNKNSNKRSQIKSTIGFKTWLALGFFGFTTFAGMIYNVIMSLV